MRPPLNYVQIMLLWALALSQSALCGSRTVSIVVRDPQRRPVVGAQVTIRCAARELRMRDRFIRSIFSVH